jgi:hypothetical protein
MPLARGRRSWVGQARHHPSARVAVRAARHLPRRVGEVEADSGLLGEPDFGFPDHARPAHHLSKTRRSSEGPRLIDRGEVVKDGHVI